ncbi:2-dehydro-3-deoxygalactonokinase [Pedobacter psychroterrae]|uniref:2-dehydro-3-deoxygalactonokinase n=1 Tax=Pedobacter psychroterrae TaxID=2530453 RepID=A0A4V2MKZ0_9SPHI|nr:2-dehydro-3-deoxygalactonokinase [Pedobacter psychroterrae]TCD00067.1 2-dehydro-3-deoxygalactonokinase [Pedobacter psychroterrae]
MMNHFLSCDWGTSSFRLRLIEAEGLKVLADIKNKQGIADTYRAWLQQQDSVDRQAFYVGIIKTRIDELIQQADLQNYGLSLTGIPVLLSGMASSTIGLVDIPYKELPFALNGSDLNIRAIQEHSPDNPLIVISGACTANDVMRGEETKVLGCAHYLDDIDRAVQLLMPGTHPKHILIEGCELRSFKTYMTGEFFDLLSGHSVLSGSVKSDGDLEDHDCKQHFKEGVAAGSSDNILHASFLVRTRQVLGQISSKLNYYYLSGLLIGAELKDLDKSIPLYLVSTGQHTSLYSEACAELGIKIVEVIDADEALIRGQQVVFLTT